MKSKTFSIHLRHLATVLLLLLTCQSGAQTQHPDSTTSLPNINPTHDPNFVRAYILCASPGPNFDETWGHAALRLICDEHQLDYVYSLVGTSENPFILLAGKGQTLTQATTIHQYLSRYQAQGRGVKTYELQLPIQAKQLLWQQMDQRLEQHPRQFDMVRHGCAQSVFQWVTAVIDRDSLQFGTWPPQFDGNVKEILREVTDDPWSKLALDGIFGGTLVTTTQLTHQQRIMIPAHLVQVLQQATAYGKPLLSPDATELIPQTRPEPKATPRTPTYCMVVWLLAMIVMFIRPYRPLIFLAWGIQFLLSLIILYLVLISTLPGTEWNWLLLPLNPLPLLCWRWRRYWSIPYALLCLLLPIILFLSPHLILTLPWLLYILSLAPLSATFIKVK